MNTLEFTVTGNHLELGEDAVSTGGSINYDKCSFTFDEEWEELERTAVFQIGSDSFRVALEEDECFIPAPCMEKEGIIRIGVYGTDGETVIATNSVTHHIEEGIDDLGEWFEEDYSLVLNAVEQMEARVGACIDDMNDSFEAIRRFVINGGDGEDSQIPTASDSPDEWYKPNEYTDADDLHDVIGADSLDDYFDFGLEPLRADFPDYVSREQIGTDADGELPVYAYSFTPQNYEKTVLLTSCVHGYGRMSFFALTNFFNELCRHTNEDRTLAYLRNRVKLVYVPAVNPAAMLSGQAMNPNGVDIGVNFPYMWSNFTRSTKGTAAGDQTETQNIMEFAEALQFDRLSAAIDFHIDTDTESGKSIFYPRFQNNCLSALTKFVNTFNYEAESGTGSKGVLAASAAPTLSNWIASEYGINACESVWHYQIFGGTYSNETYTKYTEYIGNLVYTMAKNSSFTCKCGAAPFVKHIAWKSADEAYTVSNASTPAVMGLSNYSFSLDSPCILTMQGCVVLDVSSACTVKINPLLYQVNSPEQSYDDRTSNSPFMLELPLSQGTHVIPVSSVLQAYYTSYNAISSLKYCENVNMSIAVCASAASAVQVKAFALTLSGISSDAAKPVVISKPMGDPSDYTANEIPVQQTVYPLGTVTAADTKFSD